MNNLDNINILLTNSYYKILNFKNNLNNLYSLIFNFCNNRNIIIYNNNINLSIINNKNYKLYDINKDFNFELFSINPYRDGIELANKLYLEYSKYILLSSYLNNKEIIISIDNNRLIKIQLLFSFSNNIFSLIKTPNYKFNYHSNTYNLYYSSNNLSLLILTHQLYNPNYFLKYLNSNYDSNSNFNYQINGYDIKYIYNQLLTNIVINLESNKNIIIVNKIRNNLIKDLLENINKDAYTDLICILLDTYAFEYYKKYDNNINEINKDTDINFNNILNMIIEKKYIQYIINILEKYLVINKLNNIYKIYKTTSNLSIINDFRLEKTNIILTNIETKKNITLLILYNSSDYELIPIIFKINKLLIPHPIVIIRFLLLNLFNLQILDKSFNKSTYLSILNKIKNCYNLEKFINLSILTKKIYLQYFGTYIDEKIDKYKLNSTIYRPWQYELKNNKLLNI
jgi:hypothetical protein